MEIFSAVENKLITAKEILDRFGVPASRALFLCNDLNDLFLTEFVGFSAAPSDAHPLIRKKVDYVSPEKGGRGFVRDVIDRILGDKINLHRYLNIQPI